MTRDSLSQADGGVIKPTSSQPAGYPFSWRGASPAVREGSEAFSGPTGPAVSVSPAIQQRTIPRDDSFRWMTRRPSRIRIDEREPAEGTPDVELIGAVGRYQEFALARAARHVCLEHRWLLIVSRYDRTTRIRHPPGGRQRRRVQSCGTSLCAGPGHLSVLGKDSRPRGNIKTRHNFVRESFGRENMIEEEE
jgi:hypothetical protein